MKVLPLVLAMASLVASVTAAQDASRFPAVRVSHVGSTATTSGSEIDEQSRGLRFRADRAYLTTAQGAGRRSIWQVLVGSEGKKRRAVPSRVRRRRASAKKRQAGSCKAPTSTQTSSSSTASAPTPSSTGDADTKTATNKVMAGYWPDWVNSNFPPTQIDFTKFDMLNYAFALPTAQFDLSIPTDPSGGLLRSFVKACKAGNTKALLSIGGWGGSTYFSPAVRTSASRKTFITNILKMYNQYSLDGIDLDWEYPGQTGAGNQLDASDTANFQTFLTELRAALPQGALITGAVSHNPWMASNGQPVQSVARAAAAMDYVMIMNYDVWGSSSVPGPNAPLANLCGNSTQPGASAAAGVKQWSAAGMPRNKILLGIPSYGYINTSGKKTLRTRAVGLSSLDGSSGSGQINFNMLVQQGALKKGADGLYDAAGGFTKYWDDCSDTPFLSDGTRVVSYDDTSSTFDKGAFASAAAIGGISVWSIDGDTKDWALVNSAIAGMSSTTASS